MMQSNAEFIPNFARQAAKLRELSKKSTQFVWTGENQAAYEALIEGFKKSMLLQYEQESEGVC